jgi:hypothetical protein
MVGKLVLSTDHELVPAGCKRPQCSAGRVPRMQVDGTLPVGERQRNAVIHSLSENIGQFKHCNSIISLFEGRMFLRCIVTNVTSARGTLHCRKTRIPCGDQLVICGQYHTPLI